jgi:deoxyribodipyrimidine photo-lyase
LEADTGIPIVDACMTELISTGYLGHKGRVLVANYLIHELKVNWLIGAEFFESLLLDYDPCSNYGNWNQVAGVSADGTKDKITSFHSQEKRLDPDGSYVERWLSQDPPATKQRLTLEKGQRSLSQAQRITTHKG